MKDKGIRAEVKRRFRKPPDSKHNYSLAANLLIQDGYEGPLRASDITFVPTSEGWFYLSAVMSVKSRKIIGLSMKAQLTEELATTAKLATTALIWLTVVKRENSLLPLF
jgi:putative transposase